MRREYYLHKRHGIYYVEFTDKASGVKLTARSTGERELLKAQLKVELWKINGIPSGKAGNPRPLEEVAGIENIVKSILRADINADDAMRIVTTLKNMGLIDIAVVKNTGRGAVPFIDFLETFWDFDRSEYIQDKLTHGYRFSRRYAYSCKNMAKAVLAPFFGDKKLNCVTTDDLKKLSNQLANRKLSTSTINQIIMVCCIPLKWAFNQKILTHNPVIGLTKFSITNKQRGILTETEATAVFAVSWKDKRAFVASLVSATTGARQGECLALRKSDIGDNTLNIAHSYTRLDGLKCPKNGHKRVVPLLPEVKAALFDLLRDNPHDVDDPFIFFSTLSDRPVDSNVILNGLKCTLDTINVDYKRRNICFHSWRHFFCSKMTEKMDGEKVAKVSGHLSESIFRKYSDHIEFKNIQEVGNVAAQVFFNIIRFKPSA